MNSGSELSNIRKIANQKKSSYITICGTFSNTRTHIRIRLSVKKSTGMRHILFFFAGVLNGAELNTHTFTLSIEPRGEPRKGPSGPGDWQKQKKKKENYNI